MDEAVQLKGPARGPVGSGVVRRHLTARPELPRWDGSCLNFQVPWRVGSVCSR